MGVVGPSIENQPRDCVGFSFAVGPAHLLACYPLFVQQHVAQLVNKHLKVVEVSPATEMDAMEIVHGDGRMPNRIIDTLPRDRDLVAQLARESDELGKESAL